MQTATATDVQSVQNKPTVAADDKTEGIEVSLMWLKQ
jgi:hypothetical protein